MTIKDAQEAPANPFQQLITACKNDPKHRTDRNAQIKQRLLNPAFREWQFDEILHNVLKAEKGLVEYIDPRHNLGFWTRPPHHIRELVSDIQREISAVAGSCLWFMPAENLHMTTLEMVSGKKQPDVDEVTAFLQANAPLQELVNYTLTHRARLGRPVVSYDASALALSFLPVFEDAGKMNEAVNDSYSYHHLRRDLYDRVTQSGCQIGARYCVPSAHITIARLVIPVGSTHEEELAALEGNVVKLVERLEDINQELRSNDWKRFGHPSRGEWTVGQEQGLELNKGVAWYGTGEKVLIGQGFP
ncbi:hypothetical protein N7476_006411 [Penicillium atrosanguineum]|uniref:DUF1868 domain-containing protein n=2 Tax=Penicillium atrosanguineum TaxID=1132637 RepID=A0A9W9PZ47_9EURO|nr:hypothetical protein N7476_006411 [Penicillium atrosanguineum]